MDDYDAGPSARNALPAIAYSYLRLSSKRQSNSADSKKYRDGYRRQIEMRDVYLAANPHLTLDTQFVLHDIGLSGWTGANIDPDGDGKLALFLAEVRAGRIAVGSYLLVESLDRMSRQQVNLALAVLLALVNAGIIVVSLVDDQVYRASAAPTQFMISIMNLSRAHEESQVKATRLRATWEQKRRVATERKITARCPSWLELVDGEFRPRPKRVEVVREVLRLLSEGWGRDRIARELNERGVIPWGGAAIWHGGTVQKVTDARSLIGEFQPHKLVYEARKGTMVPKRVPVGDPIPDYFPRVVDNDLWDRAQAVAVKRRRGKAPNAGGRLGTVVSNLFGTVAHCEVCGQRMAYRERGPRSFPVLRCSGERAGACSNSFRYFYHDNENAILSWLVTLDLSAGAAGEASRLDEELRTEVARTETLQAKGEAIVREVGAQTRFARAPLAEIEERMTRSEQRIAELRARLATLKATGGNDERRMAVAHLIELFREKAPQAKVFAARSRIRQIIRDTFETMLCHPDGTIVITTIDGREHRFRDGYWWYEPDDMWVPWAGAMLGGGYQANKAELARRGIWLAAHRKMRDARSLSATG